VTHRDFNTFFKNPRIWAKDLVAIGGDFSPDRLLYSYTHGIFPWSEDPIRWYCLDPRAIFDLDKVHFSKTVLRKVRQNRFKISTNLCFETVVQSCGQRTNGETWITDGFVKGYTEFHKQGYAHSVEVWSDEGELVGGVYGVAIGKFFAGESMFAFESDAGKIALYHLFQMLKKDGFQLFDTQELNFVTFELGAYSIPKLSYLDRLDAAKGDCQKWINAPRFLRTH
jgi:leucyl/phenylalanyl-tRNA---protein transferase